MGITHQDLKTPACGHLEFGCFARKLFCQSPPSEGKQMIQLLVASTFDNRVTEFLTSVFMCSVSVLGADSCLRFNKHRGRRHRRNGPLAWRTLLYKISRRLPHPCGIQLSRQELYRGLGFFCWDSATGIPSLRKTLQAEELHHQVNVLTPRFCNSYATLSPAVNKHTRRQVSKFADISKISTLLYPSR